MQIRSPFSRILMVLFSLGGTMEGAVAKEAALSSCDQLAAHPEDPQNPPGLAGVAFEKIDLVAAERACAHHLENNPEDPRAHFLYGRVIWASGDADRAAHYFEQSVSGNYLLALEMLGVMRLEQSRLSEAFSLLIRASVHDGFDNAKYDAGTMLYYGFGTNKDVERALGLLKIAAENGFVPAMSRLAEFQLEQGNIKAAAMWLERGLQHHDINAYLMAARLSLEGVILDEDHEKAQFYLKEAYLRGSHEAAYNYAKLSLSRMGEAPPKGFEGYLDRMTSISEAVRFSLTDPKERDKKILLQVEAYYKFIKVKNLVFDTEAKAHSGAKTLETEALEVVRRYAENGVGSAQYGLGNLHELGLISNASLEKALEWYEKAMVSGNPNAETAIKRLCDNQDNCVTSTSR